MYFLVLNMLFSQLLPRYHQFHDSLCQFYVLKSEYRLLYNYKRIINITILVVNES